jgi:hypothetical protein
MTALRHHSGSVALGAIGAALGSALLVAVPVLRTAVSTRGAQFLVVAVVGLLEM